VYAFFDGVSCPSLQPNHAKSAPSHGQTHHGTLEHLLGIKELLLGLSVFFLCHCETLEMARCVISPQRKLSKWRPLPSGEDNATTLSGKFLNATVNLKGRVKLQKNHCSENVIRSVTLVIIFLLNAPCRYF
jgi:hypothetical protein